MNPLSYLLAPIVVAYTFSMGVLIVYLSNMVYLALLGIHKQKFLQAKVSLNSVFSVAKPLPFVTIQLPIYNERYVIERLIDACASLDYPKHLFEIQVLDDSTDDTKEIVANKVNQIKQKNINIHHLHRDNRSGFKAGALANGLQFAKGEFIAIFDADFLPQPDFLKRMLPHFENQNVAFVQARWGHLNRDYSLLTLLQSFALDAHFAIDQLARSTSNYIFNFNGTAGIWRKSAIQDAGGWQADTLTEDMDLSYRVFLKGWSAYYAGDVEAPAELPVSFTAYRRQQYRWARGSLECAIKYIPIIWKSNFSFAKKFQATLHLTGYLLHLLAILLMFFYPLLLSFALQYPSLLEPIGIGLLLNALVLLPAFYFTVAQQLLKKGWLFSLPLIFLMSMFASGMVLNTARALFQIAQKKLVPFERTPKFGITHRAQNWLGNRYQIKIDYLILFEFLLAFFNLWTAWFAFQLGYYLMMMYAFFFAFGLFFFAGFTLFQSISARFFRDVKPDSA
ncbi:MAG: glycosyltransferase [Anaerolineales bacterium]|nr:glycosyltransferase [Anaerolineales bacterium]MBX3038473.1 glycosyltransferase [Anaerolineales bacterium]